MKSLAISAVALSSVVAPAFADNGLKVINYANTQYKPRVKISRFNKQVAVDRAKADQVTLKNQVNLYAIDLEVGTPSQNISVQIDTGSSDLWFPVTGSSLCRQKTAECDSYGSYSSGSSTFKNLGETFSISYGDGTQISGTFVTDNVQIGGDTLKSVQFAACNSGSSQTGIQGILGIGYITNEASAASSASGTDTYPNLLSSMKSQGFINTLAYSMWLNDPNSGAGNVLFGGVDSAKYTGNLISMPVVPNSAGNYDELIMPLTGISFSADGSSFTYTPSTWLYPALIDSGTTLMYLPDDVANAIAKSLGATFQQGTPFLPCNVGSDATAKLTFTFNGANGAKIDVQLDDLLADAGFTTNGAESCELLVSGGAPDGLIILGDAFMRSAYISYDLTNNMIAIAQAKFNTTDSNIQEINSSGIPGASVMSALVGQTAVATTATDNLPGSNPTAVATGSGGGGALETTAPVPTFTLKPTKNAAPVSARSVPTMSIYGVIAGTITLLSAFGGALMIWL